MEYEHKADNIQSSIFYKFFSILDKDYVPTLAIEYYEQAIEEYSHDLTEDNQKRIIKIKTKMLQLYDKLPYKNKYLYLATLMELGNYFLDTNDYKQATNYYNRVINEIKNDPPNRLSLRSHYEKIADKYYEKEKYHDASDYYKKLIAMGDTDNYKYSNRNAYLKFADSNINLKNYRDAGEIIAKVPKHTNVCQYKYIGEIYYILSIICYLLYDVLVAKTKFKMYTEKNVIQESKLQLLNNIISSYEVQNMYECIECINKIYTYKDPEQKIKNTLIIHLQESQQQPSQNTQLSPEIPLTLGDQLASSCIHAKGDTLVNNFNSDDYDIDLC